MVRISILILVLVVTLGASPFVDVEPHLHNPPLGVAMVNWAHPLARGLSGAFVFTNGSGPGVDLVRGIGGAFTDSGVLPKWRVGPYGMEVKFNGTSHDQFIDTNEGKVIAGLANSTILVFANPTALANRAMYAERASSGNDIWKFEIDNSFTKLEFTHRDDANTIDQNLSNTTITDGVYRQLGMTKAGTAITFYVNGKADGTATLNGTDTLTDTIHATIGGDIAGGGATIFNDSIVFVYRWSRALSAAEMLWLTKEPYAFIQQAPAVSYARQAPPGNARKMLGVTYH